MLCYYVVRVSGSTMVLFFSGKILAGRGKRAGTLFHHDIMASDEVTGLISAALAALCFGSYGVPMKGEAATRVDVDPLVFQTFKAVAVLVSALLLPRAIA